MLAETELNRMYQRLEDILQCANVGSWDWWIQEQKVLYDKRWCETLGLDFEETPMELSTWETRIHPDDKIKAEEDIQRHLAGETDVYQNVQRMKHANGNWIWVVETGKISERDSLGNPMRFTGTQLEITKQKIIEQELRNNEEKVLAIYEASNDAIMILNQRGFYDCNKKTLEMFNLKSKNDFINLHPSDLSPEFQPDGQLSFQKAEEEIKIAYHKGINRLEWMHQKRDGQAFPAEVLLSAFHFQGEKVLMATVRDISNRKKLEKNLEEQRKISQHQTKLASIGQLAAGVGHEINNPLAIIKGYLSALESDLKEKLEGELKAQSMIHKIDIATDRISNIVKGLRTFSRSDSILLGDFNFKEAIEETIQLLREIYLKEGVTLLFESESDKKFTLYGNKGRMEQVILNLLSNAKDATEGQPNRAITLRLKEISGKAILTVEDNGKGIPASVADRIFDPFFTTKDVNKGTGIGLAITSSIIKEHEGDISFTTQKDVGTIFKIELPVTKDK
jgi:PAS domain S-box-containing protein